MAFHRVTPFFRPAVRSILDQTFRDWELVLVDNGTGQGLAALGDDGRDPRLRLISHATNLGIAAAHNAAVAAARGEFIALLDYDDLALPTRLEKQVAALCAAPGTGLVASCAETIDAAGRVTGREFALTADAAQRAYTQYAAPVVTPVYAGRREIFADLPYRREFTYGADYDFLARAAECCRFAAVPEVLLRYRHHPGQTTVEQAARIARERCVVRLLAARRRAGRPEGDDWPGLLQAGGGDGDLAWLMRQFAGQALAEDFPVLAAYESRRSFAVRRTPGALAGALRLFGHIWQHAGLQRRAASRMFFMGPVRALRLQPA